MGLADHNICSKRALPVEPELQLHSKESNDHYRTMCWDTDFKYFCCSVVLSKYWRIVFVLKIPPNFMDLMKKSVKLGVVGIEIFLCIVAISGMCTYASVHICWYVRILQVASLHNNRCNKCQEIFLQENNLGWKLFFFNNLFFLKLFIIYYMEAIRIFFHLFLDWIFIFLKLM